MEQKKTNFFSRIVKSITDFKFYHKVSKESMGKAFGYLILFALLLGIVGTIRPILGFNEGINLMTDAFTEKMPYFVLEDGELTVDAEMPIVFEGDAGELFVIDTSGQMDETALQDYRTGIFVSKDYMVTKNNDVRTQTIHFKQMGNFTVTKDDVERMIPMLKYISILIVLGIILGTIVGKLIGTLVVSLIGLIVNGITKANLDYGTVYKIGIYGITLPSIIKIIVSLLPFGIPYFTIIYYAIVVYYLWKAMEVIKETKERQESEQWIEVNNE